MSSVLVVEDDRKIAMSLAVRLRSEGHEVSLAPDAMTGVSMAVKEPPDLVILDISMPAGNGFTVAERLKNNVKTAATPFIMITASRKPGLRDRAENLGATAFFEKPYDGEELMAAVRTILPME